jgi:hypothetical protein
VIGWDVTGVAWGLGALGAALAGAGGVLALRARGAAIRTEAAPGVS